MDNLLDPSLYTASGSGSGSGSDRYPDPISASLDTKTHLLAEDMAMMQNDIQGPNSAYDHVARQQHEGDMGPALNGAYTPADEGKVVLEAKSGGKKKAGGEKEGEKVKRTRQSQSCDACRSRKVKCDRPVPTESTPDPNSDAKCTHCRTLDMPCTFDYKPKKRGPPNRYLEKLQAEAQSGSPSRSPAQHGSTGRGGSSKGQGPITAASLQSALHAKDMADAWGSAQVYGQDRPVSRGYEAGPEMGWLGSIGGAGNEGVGGAGYAQPGSAVGSSFAHPAWTPPERPHSHSHSQTQSHHNPLLSPSHTLASATASAAALPLSFPTDPLHSLRHPPSNPLDALLPRSLLNQIIALYFDYVYALIPIIHRPTFMHDLSHNREERPGQEEWTCMTLALVASTLVQVPRSFVALPRREVRMLAETCYVRARAYLGLSVDGRASVQLCTSLYLLTFTANLLHRPAEGALMFGALAGMHLRGHWTDPSTYSTLSPLEAQLRRRIYWLAYGGDRSWAAIEGTSCIYPEEDVGGMPYPLEIDDEFISETGVSDQPAGTTSLISGFVCISRLYKICGHVMDRRRRDKKSPPQGLLLQMRLNEVDDLYDQAMGVMDGCAEPLRLDLESDTRSNDGFSDDWDAHASAGIRSLFLDPKASKAVVKDAYLVQQANIYVAQQMVRYMVILYREDLYELQRLELARQSGSASADSHGPIGKLRRKSSTRRDWSHNVAAGEEKEQVATDLLAILQKIPIQVIAINSVSVVTKVRFVASSLLDALANPAEVPDDPSPAQVRAANKTQRAQTYLWDFLRILSEIEALYSLDDTGST